MALSRSDQADILLADFARWADRENGSDPTSRAGIEHGSMDRKYMRGMDLIPQNESKRQIPRRVPRTRYSNPTLIEGTSPNVIVRHADGTTEVRSARSFRPESKNRRSATKEAAQSVQRINAANLAPAMIDEA